MDDRHLNNFEAWLDTGCDLNARTIGSRTNNCKRVEHYDDDLDSLFDTDRLASLQERQTYSTEDATYRRTPKHMLPINGDVRTGTATLMTAVTLCRTGTDNGAQPCPDIEPAALTVAGRIGRQRGQAEPRAAS